MWNCLMLSCHLSYELNVIVSTEYLKVPCGKDGQGYSFKIPGKLVKTLLPALKWGLLFLRIALATQGTIQFF